MTVRGRFGFVNAIRQRESRLIEEGRAARGDDGEEAAVILFEPLDLEEGDRPPLNPTARSARKPGPWSTDGQPLRRLDPSWTGGNRSRDPSLGVSGARGSRSRPKGLVLDQPGGLRRGDTDSRRSTVPPESSRRVVVSREREIGRVTPSSHRYTPALRLWVALPPVAAEREVGDGGSWPNLGRFHRPDGVYVLGEEELERFRLDGQRSSALDLLHVLAVESTSTLFSRCVADADKLKKDQHP
jgi:hypothetical protein